MAKDEKGYVYILTNPAFRENWVKIGKSSRPVDVRSKELDNTAVPLPFQIYATMSTVKYAEEEYNIVNPFYGLGGARIDDIEYEQNKRGQAQNIATLKQRRKTVKRQIDLINSFLRKK